MKKAPISLQDLRRRLYLKAKATRVWDDDNYILWEDREDESGEMRWHAIGLVDDVLLLVVHAYRRKRHGKEIIRIISARKARKSESAAYFQ